MLPLVHFQRAALVTLVSLTASSATLASAGFARNEERALERDTRQSARELADRWAGGDGVSAVQLLDWSARFAGSGVRALFAEIEEREGQRRDSTRVAALRRTLDQLPQLALEAVTSRGGGVSAEPYRIAGLWTLSFVGTIDDLQTTFWLSAQAYEEQTSTATLEALEAALDGIFDRSIRHISRVRGYTTSLDLAQKACLIRALGRHPSNASFTLLGELLADDERFHAMILSRMGSIANSARPSSEEGAIARVRDLLRSRDLGVQREATLTLGKLEDRESLPLLIELLHDEDERLAANAHWALMRISGRNFRPEARQWEAWHTAELEWWSTRAQELIGLLGSGRSGEVAPALNELTQHGLFRHEIARELRPLLGDRRNDIVLLCTSALYSLRSAVALPELIHALQHRDPRIQESALRALEGTTGLELPPDPLVWREALDLELY